MATLDEIGLYIEANTTGFTQATNLWLAKMPDSAAATSVVLVESGGAGPSDTYSALTFEAPNLQVISRSTRYDTARANADTIWQLLHAVTDVAMATSSSSTSTTRYLSIMALQSPFPMGTDSEERELISCNFSIRKELSP